MKYFINLDQFKKRKIKKFTFIKKLAKISNIFFYNNKFNYFINNLFVQFYQNYNVLLPLLKKIQIYLNL